MVHTIPASSHLKVPKFDLGYWFNHNQYMTMEPTKIPDYAKYASMGSKSADLCCGTLRILDILNFNSNIVRENGLKLDTVSGIQIQTHRIWLSSDGFG